VASTSTSGPETREGAAGAIVVGRTTVASHGESAEPVRGSEDRIARARSAISASFEELIARGEAGRSGAAAASARGAGAAGPAPGPGGERPSPIVGAAIDARLEAAEAALRSRLDAMLSEGESVRAERLRADAAAHRKLLDGQFAGALRAAVAELRREHEAERAELRRELDAAGRAGTAAAVERIDGLRAAAVRDAARTAEAVAESRLHAVRESLTSELRRDLDGARSDVGRDGADLERRVGGLVAGLRDEHAAAAAERESEARGRIEARLGALEGELQSRIDRALATARASLEETGTAALAGWREEARAGARAMIEREAAKLEARLAAAGAGIEAALDERIADAERRIAAAGRALEREDRIRERTQVAEREAATRVREAERRLADLFARLDRARSNRA
jgi:hypothetical protein